MNTDRPLDGLRSVQVKLAVLVGVSVVAAAVVSEAGAGAGVPGWLTVPVTVAAALGVTQWLARGMTSPLREMTAAASAMATGDYSRRVAATSYDEVGALARAFNTMAADLAASDQQRRQLVATVSHELRTPLAAQQALLENLVDGVSAPDSAALRTALAQAERLGALVADLLDLSRVDGGLTRLDLAPVELGRIVGQGVAEARAGGAERRGITIDTSVDTGLVVEADAGRIAQLLANLLDNAVRHSPDGGTVTVTARPHDAHRWALEVADEGPGIPAERAGAVFDRFGSWPGSGSGGGTGLGLAIASWVCELHGGSIAVRPPDPPGPGTPEPGTPGPDPTGPGARIRAVLPRHPSPAPHPTPHPKEPPMPTAAPATIPPDPIHPAPPPPQAQAPQFMDTLFGALWPERGLATRTDLVLAAGGVGAVAALVLPDRALGLGVAAVLVLSGALVLRASVRRRSPWTLALAALALGLSTLVVLRAAEWVAVLAVLIAGLLVTAGLTGARSVASMAAGAAAWPLSALRGLPLLGRSLSALSRFSLVWPVLRTAALSLAALVVFGGLFASGDAVFGSWARAVLPEVNADGLVLRSFIWFFVAGTVLAACYLAANPPQVGLVRLPEGRRVARPFEWLVPVGLVVAVFAVFVAAQASAMWGGHAYLRRTTGLTYAQYVHQGFGQLTAVTFLTLVTVALAARKAPAETAGQRLTQRLVFGVLCALALVVVASALYRMSLYQQAYGFTVLRLLVIAFELWMGLLLVLVLVARLRLSGGWLPRAALASAAAFALAVGLANPEGWVAERNIDRYHATGKLDAYYLQSLGDDAAPAIAAGLPADLAACVLDGAGQSGQGGVLDWNLGRARAQQALARLAPAGDGGCAALMGAG